ncbi:unnamed protein product [Gongylonema pulchrum]|uniref:NADH dehydrogenase [ubiquinone] 1 alpha subcomplex subunit 13 n=1 Tax=Gongylonema pulchrum TaxID=637853 RepID=A0A183E5S1_9BILA|nr:unnamed protein product [Gongylonema pulchrum]
MTPFLYAERDRRYALLIRATVKPLSGYPKADMAVLRSKHRGAAPLQCKFYRWLKLLKENRQHEIKLAEISDDKAWCVGTWYGEPVYFTLRDRWWDPTPHVGFL